MCTSGVSYCIVDHFLELDESCTKSILVSLQLHSIAFANSYGNQ